MMLITTGLVYKWLWLRSAGVDLPHICFNEQSVNVNCIKEEVWLQWHLLELFLRVESTLHILWYLFCRTCFCQGQGQEEKSLTSLIAGSIRTTCISSYIIWMLNMLISFQIEDQKIGQLWHLFPRSIRKVICQKMIQ